MAYSLLADGIVVLHLIFIIFALLGGLLVFRWRRIIWLHLPVAFWAASVEFSGWICPLTPLENWLRMQAGASSYSGGFIEHYFLPLIYPSWLTYDLQIILGSIVIATNALIYWLIIRQWKKQRQLP